MSDLTCMSLSSVSLGVLSPPSLTYTPLLYYLALMALPPSSFPLPPQSSPLSALSSFLPASCSLQIPILSEILLGPTSGPARLQLFFTYLPFLLLPLLLLVHACTARPLFPRAASASRRPAKRD